MSGLRPAATYSITSGGIRIERILFDDGCVEDGEVRCEREERERVRSTLEETISVTMQCRNSGKIPFLKDGFLRVILVAVRDVTNVV